MRHPAHLYEYVHQDITPGSSRTTLEIDTAHGVVSRLLKVDGNSPAPMQCAHNLAQLDRVASSARLQRSLLKNQESSLSRREQLFQAIPRAFIFHYQGVEKGTGWIRMGYSPNPAFRPSSRVEAVLQGLAGDMWVDPSSQHLVRIDGRVIKSVSFGWGIFAKLYPGGTYLMEQAEVPGGDWQVTKLRVNLHGTMLVFMKLNVDMKEVFGSFREMPDDLTIPDAVEMLKRVPVSCTK